MQSFAYPLPDHLFVAAEAATIFATIGLPTSPALASLRDFVREGLIQPTGVIGKPSRTAAHVYSAHELFAAAILLALSDISSERRVMRAVLAALDETDETGASRLAHIWTASTRDAGRESWLLRVDVVRPTAGERQITAHLFTSDTPNQFRPAIPEGAYRASLFVDLADVAEGVARGIAKVLGSED